ncbi:PREDICTED: uncharacterized protein LOC103610281 [Galeopterus variegatus]|uniref:Uncharacterized protein LOC103610281 n=1 Tax=Galeopterus variegatus TaxID=482537 RepID=A0ABM0SIL5_GALVR|nr:PREDICTED: uncharacterized protein LOC103610281 [Galeopterus variegatus]
MANGKGQGSGQCRTIESKEGIEAKEMERSFVSNSAESTSQPAGQTCQKNIKDREKEVKGDTSEAVFHQTGAVGKSKENGDEHMSASINGKQNSSFLPKDKKQPPSDSKIHRGKENDDSPLTISHQLKKILPVVMFNDCEESLSGKITLQDFPSTVEAIKPAKGKFITEVKCGAFDVQIEIKKSFSCKTGIQFPTKNRYPKYHCSFRNYFPKNKNIFVELKPKVPSKYKEKIARTEIPSLKISIAGKETKVKYMSNKQNILINITHPKRRRKITKYRNTPSSHTTKESSSSPSQSGIRDPEKRQLKNKHQNSDCFHGSSPIVFAVQKEENFDTVVVSLTSTPEKGKNNPDTLSSVLDDCKVESAICQQKVFKINQNTPRKKHFSEAETLLKNIPSNSHDTLKTTSLSNTDLSKMPFEDPKDVDKERKINFDIPENITSNSHMQQSTKGINYLPSTITNIFPVQDGKDSNFCSLSSLSMQLLGEKGANIYCKGSETPPAECCENSNSVSFPSSRNALKSSTSFSPSHWTTRHSESKETSGNTFSFQHYAESVIDYEREHADVTDRNLIKAVLNSDSHMKAQQLLARKRTQCLTPMPISCSSLAAESPLNSVSHSTEEWDQMESQASHPETAAPSETKVPVMTFLTDELEQRLITQNNKEDTVDSNCPMGMKNSKESPSSLRNVEKDKCQLTPVAKNECHRDFENLSNENHDEVCFQMDFPPNTAESNCAVCATDNLFLFEKTLTNVADQYGNQDEKRLGLTSCKQEPAECQRISSTRSNSEDENKNDSNENYYHQIDILLSPQKQKALKGTSQPAGQTCQKNIKDREKEVKGDTSEAVFHQTGAVGKSKENGDEHMSASINGKQNSSFLPKDKKQPPSDSKIHRGKENDDSPLTISHQLKKILPVVMFNDCEESLSGKITLQDFPSTVEAIKPAKGKFITEVKCGAFDVQIEIKKSFSCKTGIQFPTKNRYPKYHCSFRNYFPKNKNIFVELKPKVPSKYKEKIARTEIPSLKISIAGKETKVKYMSNKQNILINITHPKRRRKITKYRNTPSSHTTKESSSSPSQSGIRDPEKRQLKNKHQNSDCFHGSSPIVFAVQKEENFDTVVVSLTSTPEKGKNNPDTLSSVLDDCKVESAICQQKVFKINQNTPRKKHFSEAETLLKNIPSNSHDTLKTTSLSNTDLSKMPFEDPKDVDKERKINFDIPENITSNSHMQQSTKGINYLPSTITNIFPVQDGKDSNFCSLSSLSMQLLGEKGANIYCKGSETPPAECCENSNSVSFPSSRNALKSSTSFSPSHWTTRHSESKETSGNTFSFQHYAESVIDYEREHADVTDRNLIKAVLNSDSHMKAQQLLQPSC